MENVIVSKDIKEKNSSDLYDGDFVLTEDEYWGIFNHGGYGDIISYFGGGWDEICDVKIKKVISSEDVKIYLKH